MTERVTLSINPVFVARFAGLPHAMVHPAASEPALEALHELAIMREKVKAEVARVTDELYRRIAVATGEVKIAYIQLRRDLHNERWSRIARATVQESELTAALITLRAHAESQQRLRAKVENLLPAYVDARLERWRRDFCESEISKGMVLSAPEFWPRLNKGSDTYLNINGLTKIAFTLLQYVSRCCTKTSPFSFFCFSAYGKIEDERSLATPASGEPRLRSHALVNTAIVIPQLIVRLGEEAEASGSYDWAWNSSLLRSGGSYLWLIQQKHYDTVCRAREPQHPEMKALFADLVAALETGATLPDARTLRPDVRDALLNAGLLVKAGFTQKRLSDEIDGYLHPERAAGTLPEGEIALLARRYREDIMAFRQGPISARINAFDRLSASLDAFARKPASQAAGPDTAVKRRDKLLIREDVMLMEELRVPRSELQPTLEAISAMQEMFGPITPMTINRQRAARLYREFFDHAAEVPLLLYLQRLFEHIKGWENSQPKGKEIDLWAVLRQCSPEPEGYRDRVAALVRTLAARARPDLRRDAIDLLPAIDTDYMRSRISAPITGAYLQRACIENKNRWVVNYLGMGAGKGIRRWCIYNDDFAQHFKRWVETTQDREALDVIILDDVSYHGDRGPRFFSHYFDLPGVRHIEPGLKPVTLQDCRLYLDDEGLVAIRTRQGVPIFAHYDSMLRITQRPFTTQFLAAFCRPNSLFPLPIVINAAYEAFASVKPAAAAAPTVIHQPRLELGDHTVLARRAWIVPRAALPRLAPTASVGTIVEAYAQWREQHRLPARVFVRIKELDAPGDTRKPQYLDFDDPVWALFLHKYHSRYSGTLFFEEALPEGSAAIGPLEDRVSELLVHWSYHTRVR